MPDLLALALRAIDDADALPVLGDAVLESGWWDARVVEMLGAKVSPPKNYRRFRALAAAPTHEWARAVYTTHLFADWAGPRGWPVAERARRPPPTREDFYRMIRGAWGAWESAGIREMVYQESPLLGMLPKRAALADALRKEQDGIMDRLARQYSGLVYAPTTEETQRYGSDRADAVALAVASLKESNDG